MGDGQEREDRGRGRVIDCVIRWQVTTKNEEKEFAIDNIRKQKAAAAAAGLPALALQ